MSLKNTAKAGLTIIFCSIASCLFAQKNLPDSSKPIINADASCGKCKYGLPSKNCELAIRINGKVYYVDGSGIDDHGDAHADNGFCNAIRQVKVQGTVVKERFKLSYFRLLPDEQ